MRCALALLGRRLVLAVAAGACLTATVRPANAIEVTCIEASKYKYIYRVFGNDRRRFASFFGVSTQRLPGPETCRAVLITGRIDPVTRDNANDNDFTRLVDALTASNGWLTTLYLASGGGNVATGLRLGQLTRMAWLKTHAVNGTSFDYIPDFLGSEGPGGPVAAVPPELEAGWRAYQQATLQVAQVSLEGRRLRCASACTFIHAGGIHRYGPSFFHRARPGRPRAVNQPDPSKQQQPPPRRSMSDLLERLQKAEALIVAHYRQMDAGSAAIAAYRSTATQTVRSALMIPVPRYIDDHLRGLCRTPTERPRTPPPRQQIRQPASHLPGDVTSAEGLDALEVGAPDVETNDLTLAQLAPSRRLGLAQADPIDPPSRQSPARQPFGRPVQQPGRAEPAPTPASYATLRCLETATTQEHLSQFAKLCPNGCDRMALLRETTRRVRALTPDDGGPRPSTRPITTPSSTTRSPIVPRRNAP